MLPVFQRCLTLSNGCPKATVMNSMALPRHFLPLDKKLVSQPPPFFIDLLSALLVKSAAENNLVLHKIFLLALVWPSLMGQPGPSSLFC